MDIASGFRRRHLGWRTSRPMRDTHWRKI